MFEKIRDFKLVLNFFIIFFQKFESFQFKLFQNRLKRWFASFHKKKSSILLFYIFPLLAFGPLQQPAGLADPSGAAS